METRPSFSHTIRVSPCQLTIGSWKQNISVNVLLQKSSVHYDKYLHRDTFQKTIIIIESQLTTRDTAVMQAC